MKNRTFNTKALLIATGMSIFSIVLVFFGSRNLQNFDAALITYLFGTVFAFFGIVYRYSVWLQRPPTWIYFKRGITYLVTGKMFSDFWFASKETIENIAFQKFIYPRGKYRWGAHFMIAVGCTSAFLITIPLIFGWIPFTMAPNSISLYESDFFGCTVLIWIPFGKFFHIIQRPAQIGAHIYKKEGMKQGMAVCKHTGEEYATNLHINDLKTVTKELGFDFSMEDGGSHLDLSPEGKRSRLAQAHLKAR